MLEMKIVVGMTVRRSNISTVYEDWDWVRTSKRPKTVAGERAYQAIRGGPSEGLPCRVERM